MTTSITPIPNAVADALRYMYSAPQHSPAPRVLIIGVSGGADSVCLLHALAQVAARWRLSLHVAHLDHSLRPDSPADSTYVARLAMAFGLPLHVQRLPVGSLAQAHGGLENGARRARYAFLSTLAARLTPAPQPPTVCVAHHANDQAETVLMNLVRGSGLRGLGGMQSLADCPVDPTGRGVRLLRPLLSVERSEIELYLRTHGLAWNEDSSNADEGLVRNRLRHAVVPVLQTINPNVVQTLARTAALLASEADRLDARDRALLADLRHPAADNTAPADRIVLNWAGLRQHDTASLRSVLRIGVLNVAANTQDFPFTTVDEFVQQLQRAGPNPISSGPHTLWGGVAWSVAGAFGGQAARLSIHRQDALPFAPDHPYLDRAWRKRVGAQGVSVMVEEPVEVAGGWTLHVQRMGVHDLPGDWKRPDDPWVAYLDMTHPGMAHATSWRLIAPRVGMRFAPLGLAGKHKNLGDLFTDRKIPVALRSGWPLIVAGAAQRVLWVCGVQVAHGARITEETQRMVRLCWRNEESVL